MSTLISPANLAAMGVTLGLCFLFPILLWVLLGRGHKGFSLAVLAGTVGFVVPQLLLRLPLMQVIAVQGWYQQTIGSFMLVQLLFLAFTAGLFETAGRVLVFRFLIKRPLTPRLGVAAGLGHGGIEAMLMVGLTYISNLMLSVLLNNGSFPTTGQMQVVADLLAHTPAGVFLLAGYERVCTVLFHMAISLLLTLFWAQGRKGQGFWLCVGLHTLVDFFVPLANLYTNYWITYGLLTGVAAAAVVLMVRQLRGGKEAPGLESGEI